MVIGEGSDEFDEISFSELEFSHCEQVFLETKAVSDVGLMPFFVDSSGLTVTGFEELRRSEI